MKIKNIRLFKYILPFKKAVQFKKEICHKRSGYIIEITNDSDVSAISEIAPLPGFSGESLEACKKQVILFRRNLILKSIPPDILRYTADLFPSVRFGIESALLLVTAFSKRLSLSQFLNPNAVQEVSVNALLHGDATQIEQDTIQKIKNGFTSFKIKVGRQSSAIELELIKKVRTIIGPSCSLRLDANKSFTYEQGLHFLESIKSASPEYIEEPFEHTSELKDYLQKQVQPVPIALDESLIQLSADDIQRYKRADALILKPTLLGYTKTMLFAREALKYDMKPVISSSFESSIGVYILASMAAIVDSIIPAGLDTLSSFEKDIVAGPNMISNGKINLSQHADIFDKIDFAQLDEVPLDG